MHGKDLAIQLCASSLFRPITTGDAMESDSEPMRSCHCINPRSQQRSYSQRWWMTLFCIFVLFSGGGASCMPKRTIPEFQPLPVFTEPPTLEQLSEVLNRTQSVQSLQSNSVTVRVNNEITLSTNLSWLREKNFRMTATIAGFKGFDMGSNNDAFWMTVRNGLTPELYYATHSEFDSQSTRRVLPISPLWLIEALGISNFDPYQLVQNPVTRADGLLELTTPVPSTVGVYQRTLVVDPKYGFTRQIFLRDPSGRLVANAQQSKHEFYSAIQSSLPHQVKVQLIPALDPPIELDISIGAYLINGMSSASDSLFQFPNTNGYQVVNLAQLNVGAPQAVTAPQVSQPQPLYPQTSYRGVPWDGSLVR